MDVLSVLRMHFNFEAVLRAIWVRLIFAVILALSQSDEIECGFSQSAACIQHHKKTCLCNSVYLFIHNFMTVITLDHIVLNFWRALFWNFAWFTCPAHQSNPSPHKHKWSNESHVELVIDAGLCHSASHNHKLSAQQVVLITLDQIGPAG